MRKRTLGIILMSISILVIVLVAVYLLIYESIASWIPLPLISGTLGMIVGYSYVFLVRERSKLPISKKFDEK